jgi:hypothetical protein
MLLEKSAMSLTFLIIDAIINYLSIGSVEKENGVAQQQKEVTPWECGWIGSRD